MRSNITKPIDTCIGTDEEGVDFWQALRAVGGTEEEIEPGGTERSGV
jgi:hypothetical protein